MIEVSPVVLGAPAAHYLDGRMLTRPITVQLIGCGGTGSQMLTGLARLHKALLALGHPGLQVKAFDDDIVSVANVGRQLFYPSDVGQSKVYTLIQRINGAYGLRWEGHHKRFVCDYGPCPDLLITCVDTAATRRQIGSSLKRWENMDLGSYWLDCGNSRSRGQVFLTGGPSGKKKLPAEPLVETESDETDEPLPDVELPKLRDVLPEIFDTSVKEDNTPSCSMAESLAKQDLFINDHVSRWALQLIWRLFAEGKIEDHGYWINLADGRVVPVTLRLPVPDPTATQGKQRKCKAGTNG